MTDTRTTTTADLSDRLADIAGDIILLGEAAKSLLAAHGGELGWRFLEGEGCEEHRRLQSGLPQASGQLQHHRHGARIVICTWRARYRIVVSTNHVVGGGPGARRNCGKHIRHSLIIVLVILLSHREPRLLEDRVNVISSAH